MKYGALETINHIIQRMNEMERNLMKRETLKKANSLVDQIKEVEEQLKVWPTIRKGQLRYYKGEHDFRELGHKLIPDEIYLSFRMSVVNHLIMKHAELTKELENLQDPVEDSTKIPAPNKARAPWL